MFPFVARLEELVEARALLNEAREQVTGRGEALPSVAMGAMIEVPAAALTPDLLAREAGFFSSRCQV